MSHGRQSEGDTLMKYLRYRNKKNGNLYDLEGVAIDCTNERDGVRVYIYSSVSNPEMKFVRECNEFLEKFEVIE